MSYVEAAFIPRRAYDALEEERVQGEEIFPGELYVAMFALAKNRQKREAAKLPVEFKDVAETESGLHIASLAILTRQREVSLSCVGEFRDGYWIDVREHMVVTSVPAKHRYPPTGSYVRTFDPHIDSDLRMVGESAELTIENFEAIAADELVTV